MEAKEQKMQTALLKAKKSKLKMANEHPGLGEGGRYHDKKHENPVAEGTVLRFALAGNRTQERQHFSTSSLAPTSMLVIFLALQ